MLLPETELAVATARPRALVATAFGIGDIIRTTPLIRVLYHLGYTVDVLVAPQCAEAADLLRGAPEVARLMLALDTRPGGVPELAGVHYDVAAFTLWATLFARQVVAGRVVSFPQDRWLREGDSACVEAIARELGWTKPIPPPFAIASGRRFELLPGTIALHPGCNLVSPWKRWHGFDELAALLPSVVVVGTAEDTDNRATYFARDFAWPTHVRDYIGKLSLPDTAALIGQCSALVSNDSGLMHIGVALGMKTLGVFGITSPAREAMPAANMVAFSKGLDCEPDCRQGAWGRNDCARHLACLTTLTAPEVKRRFDEVLASPSFTSRGWTCRPRRRLTPREPSFRRSSFG
jgi:ADP-heptose:LPS heptosyltransferase